MANLTPGTGGGGGGPYQVAHEQLLVLGGELALVMALAVVASQPGWGAPVLMLLVLLWGLFLFQHAGPLRGLLGLGPAQGAA